MQVSRTGVLSPRRFAMLSGAPRMTCREREKGDGTSVPGCFGLRRLKAYLNFHGSAGLGVHHHGTRYPSHPVEGSVNVSVASSEEEKKGGGRTLSQAGKEGYRGTHPRS